MNADVHMLRSESEKSSLWSQHRLDICWTVKLSLSSDMKYNPASVFFTKEICKKIYDEQTVEWKFTDQNN